MAATAAAALAERLKEVEADVLVTAEAKSIPLIYEMSALMGVPYVILRKDYKSYMGDALSAEASSPFSAAVLLSVTSSSSATLSL